MSTHSQTTGCQSTRCHVCTQTHGW